MILLMHFTVYIYDNFLCVMKRYTFDELSFYLSCQLNVQKSFILQRKSFVLKGSVHFKRNSLHYQKYGVSDSIDRGWGRFLGKQDEGEIVREIKLGEFLGSGISGDTI